MHCKWAGLVLLTVFWLCCMKIGIEHRLDGCAGMREPDQICGAGPPRDDHQCNPTWAPPPPPPPTRSHFGRYHIPLEADAAAPENSAPPVGKKDKDDRDGEKPCLHTEFSAPPSAKSVLCDPPPETSDSARSNSTWFHQGAFQTFWEPQSTFTPSGGTQETFSDSEDARDGVPARYVTEIKSGRLLVWDSQTSAVLCSKSDRLLPAGARTVVIDDTFAIVSAGGKVFFVDLEPCSHDDKEAVEFVARQH